MTLVDQETMHEQKTEWLFKRGFWVTFFIKEQFTVKASEDQW